MNADVSILLPDLRGGGAEKVCVSLARAFLARGCRVEIVLLRRRGPWLQALPPGVEIVDLDAPRVRRGFLPLVRRLRARPPRSLLAAMWPMTAVAVWAVRAARVPTRVVVSDHNNLVHTPEGRSWRGRARMAASMRLSYPAADAVVAVSAGVADTIAGLSGVPRDRITVIHNPIEVSLEEDAAGGEPDVAPRWMAADGARRLIAIGSLKPQKDFATLLRAFQMASASRPAKLLLLGEGPLRVELEALVRDLGLGQAVEMPGFVERPERFLRRADLFVLSSAWEGFGNVIVEALACGVPVVSTDCPSGPREILAGGRHGRLVPPRDPGALSTAIVETLGRTHDREALVARSRDFSAARAADLHLQLLLPGRT